MLEARYADVTIGITSLQQEAGQDWATSSPTRGSNHTLQPRGLKIRRTPCEIAFVGPDFEERWRKFDELANVEDPQPQIFVHPLRGSYLAIVEGWTYAISEVGNLITGSCTFVESSPPAPPSPVAAASSATSGTAGVRIVKDKADAAALAAGTTFVEGTEALAVSEEWASSDGIDARSVQAQLDATTSKINARLDQLKPSNNAEWQLFKSMLRVNYQLRMSALAVIAEGEAASEFVVEAGAPLIAIARRLYGGAQAQERAEDLRRLNNLRAPGYVPAGTRLKVVPP